jgi:hypothetical protein
VYHRSVSAPARLTVVAALPPLAGFRRAVAVDVGRSRAVVVSFPPPVVTADPARREALLRAAVAAGKVRHPGIAPVLGVETVDGELAVVEEHRPGTPLRALLDAAGRTPPDVAVRVGLDVAAGLTAAHAVEIAGARLAHGAVDAAAIVVGDRGDISLSGLGLVAGATPEADLRRLGAILHECVAGEPPAEPPCPLDVPGVPPALAAAVDRATGAAHHGLDGPASLAAALGAALATPAAPSDVAAYLDAILPPDEGERAAVRTTLAAALARVATSPATPAQPLRATTPPDSARTFARPAPTATRSRLPAVAGAIALAVGFAAGLAAQRALRRPPAPASPSVAPFEVPAPAASPPVPTPAPAPPAPEPSRAEPAPAPKAGKRPAPAPRSAGKGSLEVTAPDDAEVFLDGRRIGRGNVRTEVASGPHRIEVRRSGAVVRERFTLAPGENWTYAVTPTEQPGRPSN